ncbi:MAG: SMP-30/gluconolactonase/LRE family protein [Anaerolineales bacterium]
MTDSVELILDAKSLHGEGPIWHAPSQRLYWVNISQGEVHVFDPRTGADRTIQVGQPVGTVVARRSGGLMVAVKRGFASLDLETEALTLVGDPALDLRENRFNDGKCDPAGRFWAGTMTENSPTIHGAGSLYCLDVNHTVTRRLTGVSISNGLAWSQDKRTMYFIDSLAHSVDAFDYDDATGAIGNRRVAITIAADQGIPDGMTMDAEGMLWVAQWGGSRVCRWDPADGRLLETIKVPASQASACAFGGPNLDELYITSARIGLDEAALAGQPHAGGIFMVKPGVRGLEAFEYAG